MSGRLSDHTGKTYFCLTGVKPDGYYTSPKGHKAIIWLWQCSCGKQTRKKLQSVRRGDAKSCGHLKSTRSGVKSLQYIIYVSKPVCYNDGDMTLEKFVELSQLPCHWCGDLQSNTKYHPKDKSVFWKYNGIDRLNWELPHNIDNCVPCCWDCNRAKGRMSPNDFLLKIKKIYKLHFNRRKKK